MATWAIEAHSKVPPTDFCFPITLDFAENGPLLYLPSGTILTKKSAKWGKGVAKNPFGTHPATGR